MSAPAFTPGPWEVHESGEWISAVDAPENGGDIMCCLPDADASDENWHAGNANLIAAAPDLYEALVAADKRLCELSGPQSEDEETRVVVMTIRAALARARGESPPSSRKEGGRDEG